MNNSKTSNNGTRIYVVRFPLKEESEEVPKKIWKWNLQSSTDINQNFFGSKFKIFILTCQNK
jgi:hypothetical protein